MAEPDYQGPYPLCSYFALAKAIRQGYKKGKFTNGVSVNIDNQKGLAQTLVNLFQENDMEEICPTEFDQHEVKIFDEKMIAWNSKIIVTTVHSTPEEELTKENLKTNEYLMTYTHDNWDHCIHVGSIIGGQDTVVGINSWDDQYQYPQVKFSDIKELFKITVVADKVPPSYSPTKHQDLEDETTDSMLGFEKSKPYYNNIFKSQPSESSNIKDSPVNIFSKSIGGGGGDSKKEDGRITDVEPKFIIEEESQDQTEPVIALNSQDPPVPVIYKDSKDDSRVETQKLQSPLLWRS